MLKKNILNLKKGFTLIEIMVVVGIIVVLAIIAIASGSAAKSAARDNQRKTDIRFLQVKLESYREQYGVYPTSLDGEAHSLVSSDILSDAVLPKDPSGYPYFFFPLQFKNQPTTCGASYYLYALLENKNNGDYGNSAPDFSLLETCNSIPLGLPGPKSYTVTSPK